ncbi:chaperone protein dnaJ 15 [Iris pallida]|uniref:Chaperone protein dnaJ 15 n=1 Tax=Iris pallida TaxID=29817 RepID=A0AAX6I482_IRIPA|nr:chaperone protein dnaJ 15 [Iris pallida]
MMKLMPRVLHQRMEVSTVKIKLTRRSGSISIDLIRRHEQLSQGGSTRYKHSDSWEEHLCFINCTYLHIDCRSNLAGVFPFLIYSLSLFFTELQDTAGFS